MSARKNWRHRADVTSVSIDELLGVRSYPVYWCQQCAAFHVDGLDQLFEGHKRHLTSPHLPLDEYKSTTVADHREKLQQEARTK